MQSHGEYYGPERDEHSGDEGYHVSVLRAETVDCLKPAKGKLIVDATLGGGGHTEALLERGAVVIGLDQDPDAIAFASERLKRFGDQFHAIHCNFVDADKALDRVAPVADWSTASCWTSASRRIQLDVPPSAASRSCATASSTCG